MTPDALAHLNPPQREAVTHTGGPLLIIAGAGSGKTRVITHRIAWLIQEQGVAPQSVFAATFTNKAAGEMRERVERLLERSNLNLPIATFHSLCARILRREAPLVGHTERFTIIDDDDQMGLIRDVLKGMGLRREDCPPPHAQWCINQAKIRMWGPREFADNLPRPEDEWVAKVFDQYQRRLEESDALDFEDLILKMVRLLERNDERRQHYQSRFEHVLVDEYQDTNLVQYQLVKLLAERNHNLCVVGDEDQSIYSWRGANIDNILNFQRDHAGAKVIKLEQNYRSSGNILRAASAVIANNTERLGKTLWTESGEGDPLQILSFSTEHDEAEQVIQAIERLRRAGVSLNEIAIFYRINAISRRFEEKLREEDIQHRVFGGVRFFERREVKDLIAYLHLVDNPHSPVSLLRVMNIPRRGVGDKTLRSIIERGDRDEVSLWDAMIAMIREKQIRGKAATGLAALIHLVKEWQESLKEVGLDEVLQQIVTDIGYLAHLKQSDPLTFESREENVDELGTSLREYGDFVPDGGLQGYLEKVALESAVDTYDHDAPTVSLMTLHTAKGLEFDVVFMVGMEEEIFPSPRALTDGRSIEEERRLFYVGLTRARKRVYLSWTQSRFLHGRSQWCSPSRFLRELPEDLLVGAAAPAPRWPRPQPPVQKTVAPEREWRSSGAFKTGQRVVHKVFGTGTVLGIKGEGSMRRLVIRFEGDELVDLLERYADLQPAGEDS